MHWDEVDNSDGRAFACTCGDWPVIVQAARKTFCDVIPCFLALLVLTSIFINVVF